MSNSSLALRHDRTRDTAERSDVLLTDDTRARNGAEEEEASGSERRRRMRRGESDSKTADDPLRHRHQTGEVYMWKRRERGVN